MPKTTGQTAGPCAWPAHPGCRTLICAGTYGLGDPGDADQDQDTERTSRRGCRQHTVQHSVTAFWREMNFRYRFTVVVAAVAAIATAGSLSLPSASASPA